MLYFLFWLAVTIVHAVDGVHFKYFIFLTHWGFIAWNGYLVLSAVTVTAAVLGPFGKWEEFGAKHDGRDSRNQLPSTSSDSSNSGSGCPEMATSSQSSAGCSPVLLEASFKLQWALFLVGGEYAVVISVLYWTFYTGSTNSGQNLYSLDSLHLHAINGIFAVVEIWLSGIPVRICHVVYSIAFGCAYILFTVLYYAAGGRDSVGNRYIYPFLDYGSNAGAAISLAVSCAVFLVGGVHLLFFVQYKIRKCFTDKILKVHYNSPKSSRLLVHV